MVSVPKRECLIGVHWNALIIKKGVPLCAVWIMTQIISSTSFRTYFAPKESIMGKTNSITSATNSKGTDSHLYVLLQKRKLITSLREKLNVIFASTSSLEHLDEVREICSSINDTEHRLDLMISRCGEHIKKEDKPHLEKDIEFLSLEVELVKNALELYTSYCDNNKMKSQRPLD